MYSILRNEPIRRELLANARTLLTTQAFALLPALAITHLFFHWKSFLLESLGFLATWFAIDFVVTMLRNFWRRGGTAPPSAGR